MNTQTAITPHSSVRDVGLELGDCYRNTKERANVNRDKNRSFFERFISERGLAKAAEDAAIAEIECYSEYAQKLWDLSAEYQIGHAKKVLLTMSRKASVTHREEITSFVMSAHNRLKRAFIEKRNHYLKDLSQDLKTLEEFDGNPQTQFMADGLQAAIQSEFQAFMDWSSSLIDDFMQSTQERLNDFN